MPQRRLGVDVDFVVDRVLLDPVPFTIPTKK